MKLRIFTATTLIVLFFLACKTSKKTTTTTNNKEVTSTNTNTTTTSGLNLAAADPYAPGDKELAAIQTKFPDVTAATLAEGQRIYVGPCAKCHGKKDLYNRTESSWKHEVDVMAPKARITDVEKDALWKYILAMRATNAASK